MSAESDSMVDDRQASRELDALVGALLTVPDALRQFSCDAAEAERMYGLDASLLHRLVSHGLPYRLAGNQRRYSFADMHYLGLRLGTAVFHLRTFASWARRLRPDADHAGSLRIHYVPHLQGSCVPITGSVLLPDGRVTTILQSDRPAAEVVVQPESDWPTLDKQLADVIEEMAATDHYMFDLNGDLLSDEYPGCTVTDCRLSARALAARCEDLGYVTRWAYGIIAAPMFSVRHFWVDVEIDGMWVPVDAVVLGLLRRFQNVQPSEWPASSCLGGLLVRLSSTWQPIVADENCNELNYSLYTTNV